MTLYRVIHTTSYSYDASVTGSYGLLHLKPRELPWQRCISHELTITPDAADLYEHEDSYGNSSSYLHITAPHRLLEITATSVVEISEPVLDEAALALSWEQARPADSADPEAWQAIEFTHDSPMIDIVDGVQDYAEVSFTPGRGIGEAVIDLMHRVYADFDYQSGSTTIGTRVADLLKVRRGVCQDFAHFMVAGLRSLGLAGQYVSGYLATTPPPGQERLVGADASHAWVGCWVPGFGWLYLDPTNDRLIDESHTTLAFGRDYADVPPVKGVIYTEATSSTLDVSVDVEPI